MPNSNWIYLDSPLIRGATVKRWQELLVALGEKIDVDGAFGNDTDAATRRFQAKYLLDVDGIVGPNTLEKALEEVEKKNSSIPVVGPIVDPSGVEIVDLRGKVPPPKNGRNMRAWSDIEGIVLHRTACVLGENPMRFTEGNYHIAVTLGGKIVLAHPFELWIGHSHNTSPWTIGIEFDGNPEGKPGYYWKPGGGPHPITDAQVKASWVLLDILEKAFTTGGSKIRYILAHRQSNKDRECDPGWECWQKIGVPWMDKLGAIPGPRVGHPVTAGLVEPVGYAGDTWGSGFQIPTEWDPRSKIPFWK